MNQSTTKTRRHEGRRECLLVSSSCLRVFVLLLSVPVPHPSIAAEAASRLSKLEVYPPGVQLDHKADLQRIVVVGTDDSGETRDLTAIAKITITPPLAGYESGRLRPLQNGEASIGV